MIFTSEVIIQMLYALCDSVTEVFQTANMLTRCANKNTQFNNESLLLICIFIARSTLLVRLGTFTYRISIYTHAETYKKKPASVVSTTDDGHPPGQVKPKLSVRPSRQRSTADRCYKHTLLTSSSEFSFFLTADSFSLCSCPFLV